MPPSAIARSVRSTISRALRRRPCARARAAGTAARDGRGNFGASPKPPWRGSNASAELLRPSASSAAAPGTSAAAPPAPSLAAARSAPRPTRRPCRARPSRRARSPAGCRRTPAGPTSTPAESRCRRRTASAPASATRSSASRRIRSSPARTSCRRDRRPGRSSRSTLIDDEVLVEHRGDRRRSRTTRAPSRGTSGTSSSRSTERSACPRRAPCANASSPHGYQSTGLLRVLQKIRTALAREAVHRRPLCAFEVESRT